MQNKNKFFYGYVIVFVVFILQIIMFGPQVSFGVFIKPMTAENGWPLALVSGAFSAASLVQACSSMAMGYLNDKIGPRLVMTICGFLIGAGLMMMYFVQETWQLYLFYAALVGVGGGGLLAPQISTIARWFVKRRNITTALLFVGGGLGGFIGPPLITRLIYSTSWRQTFLYIGIVLFVMVILGAQFLRKDPSTMGQFPDGMKGDPNNKESSETSGMTTKQAMKTKKLWFFAIVEFCIGFVLWTVFVHIVPYAIDRGITPETAALVLSCMSISQPVGSILISLVADKIDNGRALVVCVCLLGAVAFLLLPIYSSWILGMIVVTLALGLGGASVLQSSLTAKLFGMKAHGGILGLTIFTFAIGSSIGTYLAGVVYDASGNYKWSLLICSALVVAAVILAIFLSRMIRKEAKAF
jgi:MFS transporter, OFA family, oxalate/formate antiporter